MAAVSKIEAGVVELRTDVGRLYVCPSTWQRAYLRWTFRNFHTLPQQVLNRRQKRLIECLSRTAIVTGGEIIPPTAIIGIVEGVRVLGMPSNAEMADEAKAAKAAVAERKLKVVSARHADVEAASSEPMAQVPAASAPIPFVLIPENNRQRASQDAEETGTPAPAQEIASASRGGKRAWWAVPVTGAAVAAVLLLAFEVEPILRPQNIQIAQPELTPPQEANVNLKTAAARAVAVPAKAPIKRPVSAPETSPAGEAQRAARNRLGDRPLTHPSADPASTTADAVNLPQIAEAPQSGFMYPVAPNPHLVGKVLLKAVIGSDGTVKQVEVLSGDRALAAAAARAVRHWHYAPPQVDGRAVDAQTHVTVSFLGEDAVSIILPPAR